MAVQIPHRVRAQVQKAGDLRRNQAGRREDPEGVVRTAKSGADRSGGVPGPRPPVGGDPAVPKRRGVRGEAQEQERADDLRPAREPGIQIREPAFLGEGVLRGHGREIRRRDQGAHPEAIAG